MGMFLELQNGSEGRTRMFIKRVVKDDSYFIFMCFTFKVKGKR